MEEDPTIYRDIILVYSPPKVASTSLITSIRLSASNDYYVMHTHDEIIFKSNLGVNHHTCVSDILENGSDIWNPLTQKNRHVFIIDIYRDPIERKISEYFHEISTLHFNQPESVIKTYTLEKIVERFNCVYPHLSNEDYFKTRFPISLNKLPLTFDFERKYLLITNKEKNVTFIKLRLQDSNEWSTILSNIFGKEFVTMKDYETKDKEIGDLYKTFLDSYQIPDNFLKELQTCPHFHYYHTHEEKKAYFLKWGKKRGIPFFNSYTRNEYTFYEKLCLENQYHHRALTLHYKDDGCLCNGCKKQRLKIVFYQKNGFLNHGEAVLHRNVSTSYQQQNTIFLKHVKPNNNVFGIHLALDL
jgi:hypothetical protein